MKLVLRRDQKSGALGIGKISFVLDVRAELTGEEQANIKKYKLGDTLLYERKPLNESADGTVSLGSALAYRMLNLTITVDDLLKGKQISCKDIVEMLAAEEQIKGAAETFKAVLHAATGFGGEEVLEIA